MKIIKNIKFWQKLRSELDVNKTLGVVMTMGALHPGHLSLIQKSQQDNDYTLVTLFVNPAQFNDQNDFINYPNTFTEDIKLLENAGVNFVLTPSKEEIYNNNYTYQIYEKHFSKMLCGRSRPGHFTGVLTVVMKFLQLAQAHRAYFGEKDYQQLKLIEGMAKAFFIPTKIIACPIVRDDNGLAYSSRNLRLSKQARKKANTFAKIIRQYKELDRAKQALMDENINIDYLEEHFSRRFAAVNIDNIRLIDNVPLNNWSYALFNFSYSDFISK